MKQSLTEKNSRSVFGNDHIVTAMMSQKNVTSKQWVKQ